MVASEQTTPRPIQPDQEFWRSEEYAPLVNHQHLKQVARDDPWQYDVASRLKNFLFRMESKKIVNFRVSGIVVHSASMLCKAKSRSMLDEGSEIQEALEVDEGVEAVDDGSGGMLECGMNVPTTDIDDEQAARALVSGAMDIDEVIDLVASGRGTVTRLLSKERLERFNVPKRIVARPLTVADLSIALNDALAGKFRRKKARGHSRGIVLPEAIKDSNNEELKVDRLIESVGERVRASFDADGEPVPFISMFEDLDNTLYIVKTFLAVLHMINKKLVEAWQATDGTIYLVPFGRAGTFAGDEVTPRVAGG